LSLEEVECLDLVLDDVANTRALIDELVQGIILLQGLCVSDDDEPPLCSGQGDIDAALVVQEANFALSIAPHS
jgi:hypothetical protein